MNVLVVGDSMLDVYQVFDVVGMSREAPVMVLSSTGIEEFYYGGAANSAANCAALGANTTLLARIGDDRAAENFKSIPRPDNLDIHYLQSCIHTIEKRRYINNRDEHIIRIDTERNQHTLETLDLTLLFDYDVLFVSDYGKGSFSGVLLQSMINCAKVNGKFVIVNGKPKNCKYYRNASVLQFNAQEATDTLMSPQEMLLELNLDNLIVTCGEHGIEWYTAEKSINIPALNVKVADVIGAGDTVAATIATNGAVNQEVLTKAVQNAAMVVSKHRTVTP